MLHQLSYKLRAQITQFSGRLSQGLSKPGCHFVDEIIYGLTASQVVMLSEISRLSRREIEELHRAHKKTPYQANRFLALLSKMFSFANAWE